MDRPIVGHVLAVLVALGVLPAGLAKLAGVEQLVANFARWGYPWFWLYVTGVLELAAGVLVLVPRTRLVGAGLALAVMVGAVATHLVSREPGEVVAPGVIGLFAALTAWTARPRGAA